MRATGDVTADAQGPGSDTRIDDLEPMWHLPVSGKEQFDLLPSHPWIWRNDLEHTGGIVPGALWRICADLVAEPIDDQRPVVAAIAPRSIIRRHGRPVDAGAIPGLWHSRRLFLIRAGSDLAAVGVVRWGDDSPGRLAGQSIELALPDGRTLWIAAQAQLHPSGGGAQALIWRELACAAVVVPVAHPLASDPTACTALIDQFERRARKAWNAYLRSSAI